MKKTGKKEILGVWFFIAMLQIFLLFSGIYAESSLLGEFNYYEFGSISQKNDLDIGKILGSLFDVLIGLVSIKQISTVNAQEVNFNCCLQTNNGALCQDVNSNLASSDPESCESPLPTKCSLTSECVTGTCVFNSGESCAANSPKKECETKGGIWNSQVISSVPECKTGACVLGSNVQLTTEKQCEIQSQSKGLEMDFRVGLGELDFPQILGSLKKGACIISQGNCRFVTISECSSLNGKFHENLLCTNPVLNTSCIPTQETTCFQDKVHFVDSCGNIANVYDSSKANSDSNPAYWEKISQAGCSVDLDNVNSLKSCGNCNRFESTQCGAAENIQPTSGDFICKDLTCKDESGKERKNGEKWCIYDSKFGDGKDPVGSEHYIASCDNGKVQVDVCGTARGQICTQRVIAENGKEFSTASCLVNEAIRCIDFNSNGKAEESRCNENPQCQITNVDVDKFFKFSMCTPKYPKGFDQNDQSDLNSKICSIANRECTVIYQKQLFGGWKCIANCECEKKKFSEKMNNLCTSLGDCGSYINYIGDGTDNIKVSGAPSVSWTEYTQYKDAEKGKYIETHTQDDFISAIEEETNASKLTPEGANALIAEFGAKGITTGILSATGNLGLFERAFDQILSGDFALEFGEFATLGGESVAGAPTALGNAITPFGVAAVGNIIGVYVGKFLANALGISGDAATVLTMATGVAGTVGAIQIAQELGYINKLLTQGQIFSAYVVVAIIIAIIILGGFGKTKKVKVNFTCLPWEAPSGGSKCDECNSDPFKPCTKYKCESLGQACQLINENTDTPICQSLSFEATPPTISPGIVETSGYGFQNPQQRSVDVKKDSGECIPEFFPVTFSLKTDEYAQCKWSFKRTADYESMENYPAEGTVYSLNHRFIVGGLSLGLLNANNITGDLIEGFVGDISIYVKCKDSFGNFNLDDYAVNFCVNSGEDVTPVLHSLTTTSPANNAKLKFGTNEINFTMWINEPAECRYSSIQGRNYNEMENSMNCSTNLDDYEGIGWPCSTTLGNLGTKSTFYIRCLDQPWLNGTADEGKRNANSEDFVYSLETSKGILEIKSISVFYNSKIDLNFEKPTEIRGGDAIFPIELNVATSGGSAGGKASCSYQWAGNYIPFLNTNSNLHSQKLSLVPGNYDIGIKCIDDAGNEAVEDAEFNLNSDNSAPIAVRTFHRSGDLIVVTNEPAKCYVSFDSSKGCNFDIGNSSQADGMEIGFSTSHSTQWLSGKTYYIKCKDLWDNQNSKCAVKVTTS